MSDDQKIIVGRETEKHFFRASAKDFKKIPSGPIAYWLSQSILEHFAKNKKLEEVSKPRQGATTSDNGRFLRFWHEIAQSKFGTCLDSLHSASVSGKKWFPYNKGGDFRRWYGNQQYVINYEQDGRELKEFHDELNKTRPGGRLKNQEYYFKSCVSWSKISSGTFAVRYFPPGFIFDVAGSAIFFGTDRANLYFNGLLNTCFVRYVLGALSPTLNFEAEHLCKIPVVFEEQTVSRVVAIVEKLVQQSKLDWNAYENSWDFKSLPLLDLDNREPTLGASYQKLRSQWRKMTLEMQRLEEENNRIFIEAYGLQDELKPDIPLSEVTLTVNPYYRYAGDKSEEELETLLLADTMRELVSYAVGCMFGRYSLGKPGLILANQGETLADYLRQVRQSHFPVDDDNVIPLLDGDWFPDDITQRFRQFLRVAFGDDHYEDNLAVIEQALNTKGKRNYSLRDYFLGEFYTDHVKRYSKRPIYWLFSSPKGSFNALIYMHRYREDSVSVVLKYLRDYREKLATEKGHQAAISISSFSSQGEKTKALKEVDRLAKVLTELEDYERDVLYPLATEQKSIDLDEGIKANYLKFGAALKKIPGLEVKDED